MSLLENEVVESLLEALLLEPARPPVCQDIARKAKHLNDLCLSHSASARKLGVSDKAVCRAIRWIGRCAGATP